MVIGVFWDLFLGGLVMRQAMNIEFDMNWLANEAALNVGIALFALMALVFDLIFTSEMIPALISLILFTVIPYTLTAILIEKILLNEDHKRNFKITVTV